MTAAPPADPVMGGVRSLEVRWIFPGQLEAAVAGWFGRFAAETESREDTYLLDPDLGGLSVKVRAGGTLEVKVYRGSEGVLEVPGRARGHLQAWQKWSFPFRAAHRASGGPAGWRMVRKRRRISRFYLAAGRWRHASRESVCAVELTEVHTRAGAWWSLGFEATGPPVCSAARSTAPPRWCSPRPCAVARC
jgi:hypothetical protein